MNPICNHGEEKGMCNICTPKKTRDFNTGAIRSADATRDDPEGYLSPLVIDRFNQYMTKHRHLPDGRVRDSDNWQKGMPLATYMKGLWRHFHHLWTRHRGWVVRDPGAAANIEEDLCAILFNVQGYLHEILKERSRVRALPDGGADPLGDSGPSQHRQRAEQGAGKEPAPAGSDDGESALGVGAPSRVDIERFQMPGAEYRGRRLEDI